MKPVLEVERLSFAYDARQPVLRDISFAVSEGECVGILGANGAGKSTLLWCLLGLLRSLGQVRWFGQPPTRTARRRVGVVFQNPEDQLFMPTISNDVALALVNRGLAAEEARERALAALAQAGLARVAGRAASQLSLGERKRAAIAAALACSPEALLLDEPTAELDPRAVRQLTALLHQLPVARLIASHHLDFLQGLCTRLLVLSEGRLIAEGPVADVLGDVALLDGAGLL